MGFGHPPRKKGATCEQRLDAITSRCRASQSSLTSSFEANSEPLLPTDTSLEQDLEAARGLASAAGATRRDGPWFESSSPLDIT